MNWGTARRPRLPVPLGSVHRPWFTFTEHSLSPMVFGWCSGRECGEIAAQLEGIGTGLSACEGGKTVEHMERLFWKLEVPQMERS